MVAARRAGFSLVEVIVALLLLSVGVLSIAGTGLLAGRMLRQAELREEMLTRAHNLLDSLVIAQDTGSGSSQYFGYRLDWQATAHDVSVNANIADTLQFVLRAAR